MVRKIVTTFVLLSLVTFVNAQDCGTLVAPTNGIVDLPSTTTLSVATYTCDAGHTVQGDPTRTCQVDNTWSGTAPSCAIKDCGSLTNPSNGAVDVSSGTTYLAIAVYSCATGSDIQGGTSRTCSVDGTWSSTAPSCQIKDCGTLSNPTSGSVTTSDGTEYGDTATFTCNVGHFLVGPVSRSCGADGIWSDSSPVCSIKDCGFPADITNGQYTITTTTYGSSATYSCTSNYAIVGSSTISCLAAGIWDNTPICSVVDCGTPSGIAGGSVTNSGGTALDAEATYTCESGYTLSGSATVTCQGDASWSTSPSCLMNLNAYSTACTVASDCATNGASCLDDGSGSTVCTCSANKVYDNNQDSCLSDCGGLSNPTNGAVAASSTTEGQTATYTCNSGYAISGTITRTCEASGSWSETAPTCTFGCSEPDPPLNGQVNISDGFTSGSVVTYSCDTGYALVGSASRVCLMDTTWNGQTPSCNKECPVLEDVKDGTVDLSLGNWATSVATYICDKNYALVGQSTRTCQSTGLWSGVEPSCLFAMFPDILIVFGVLFIVLFIVDIVVLGMWLYTQINKPKKDDDEENEDDDPEDKIDEKKAQFSPFMVERPDDSMMHSPPSFMNRKPKSKYTKIAPEIIEDPEVRLRNSGHPPPKKPPFGLKVEKLDRSSFMKTPRDKKKSLGREKTFETTTIGPANGRFRPDMMPGAPAPRAPEPSSFEPPTQSKQVNLADEVYNGNSDDNKRQPSPAEADQLSLDEFDIPEPKANSTMEKSQPEY